VEESAVVRVAGQQAVAGRRTSTLSDRVVAACCLAWCVPVVVAVVRAVTSGWYPASDEASIAIRAREHLT